MSRQSIVLFHLGMVLTLLAGACDAAVTPPPAEPSPGGQAETATADGFIRIGAVISETGMYAWNGKDARQGYELFAGWINTEYGGVRVGNDRYRVEMIYYDDESDPDTAANLTERLIREDKVHFLLGPGSSDLTASASAVAEKHDVILLDGTGVSESLFSRGFQNFFAVATPAGNFTQSTLKLLAGEGAGSVAVAYEDTAFPVSIGIGTESWARDYGMDVLAVETYGKDVENVSAIVTRFRALDPDVFVSAGHFYDALLFVRAARELGFSPRAMLIAVGPSSREFSEELGRDANYILGLSQWEPTMKWSDEWMGSAADYAARYAGLWGESPTVQAAGSTAAAVVLVQAIEKAGSLDTDAVRQALRSLEIMTFFGPVKFDDAGRNVGKPMCTIQVQDGRIRVVSPADGAVAPLVYPMPDWIPRP